ncbi:MAG: hypothetical protein NDJ89_04980 [Oligoflexia bacterium]|nr:hypothetical protein [Oligoflexia bacterium]
MTERREEIPGDDDSRVFHIKKYGNRRFYSSSKARFVTLEEIASAVRGGRKIRVTDANEQDITCEILTQILLEGGKARHFPVELLEQMVRLNEEALRGFWQAYLDQSLKVFQGVQKEMQQLYRGFSLPLFAAWDRNAERNTQKSSVKGTSRQSRKKKPAPRAK